MRRGRLTVSLLGVLLSLGYLAEALNYPLGTMAQPGPASYPLVIGALLLGASLSIGLEAYRSSSAEPAPWPLGADRRRLAAMTAASAGYVLALPLLGHLLSGTLIALVVLQVMGLPRWPLKIALALALGVGSYYLFAVVLGVPLPAGTLFG